MDAKLEVAANYTPDDIYNNAHEGTTFIFTPRNKLYVADYSNTHGDLVDDDWELKKELNNLLKIRGSPSRTLVEKVALLGRIGDIEEVVVCSFWNSIPLLFNQLLKPCVQTLIKEGFLQSDDVISLPPYNNPRYASEIFGRNIQYKELTPQQKQDVEQKKALHLMGQEKGDELKKRGYKPKSPYKDLIPGQKYWALSSENFSFKNWLNMFPSHL